MAIIGKNLLRSTGVAFLLSGAIGMVILPMTVEIAQAKGGGKGGGNSGGNRGGNGGGNGGGQGQGLGNGRIHDRTTSVSRSNRGVQQQLVADETDESRGNGRGALASELKGLNAAHASQTALEHASPNSMPGKLYSYQMAINAPADAEAELDGAVDELVRLTGLTAEEITAEFAPTEAELAEGVTAEQKYADAIIGAEGMVVDAEVNLETAEADAGGALETLTGGGLLSPEALAELHSLLGLEAPTDGDGGDEEELTEGDDDISEDDTLPTES